MRDATEAICIIIVIILSAVLAHTIGYAYGREEERKKAVECKVAEYYLDEQNEKRFRYNTAITTPTRN